MWPNQVVYDKTLEVLMDLSVDFNNILRARFLYESAFCQNSTREKLCKALSYKKCVRKMLMQLTPDEWLHISILLAAFCA